MLTNDGHFVAREVVVLVLSIVVPYSWQLKKYRLIIKLEYNMLQFCRRRVDRSHYHISYQLVCLSYTQSPLKIRPKSLALSYCANAPYHHPCRSNRSQPPFRTAEDRIILLVVPKQSYWSGSLHLSLLSRPNAGSLSSTFLKESPFD